LKSGIEVVARYNYTDLMMSRQTTKTIAVILAIIVGLVFISGYSFVYNGNIPPETESTLDFIVRQTNGPIWESAF
jgi:hypothetical protein